MLFNATLANNMVESLEISRKVTHTDEQMIFCFIIPSKIVMSYLAGGWKLMQRRMQ